jgi:hypothetical protein
MGLSGLPSIWMIELSFTKTRCAQPTAQNGHTDETTRSACSVRGRSAA